MKVEIGMVSGKIIVAMVHGQTSIQALAEELSSSVTFIVDNPPRIIVCDNVEYIEEQAK